MWCASGGFIKIEKNTIFFFFNNYTTIRILIDIFFYCTKNLNEFSVYPGITKEKKIYGNNSVLRRSWLCIVKINIKYRETNIGCRRARKSFRRVMRGRKFLVLFHSCSPFLNDNSVSPRENKNLWEAHIRSFYWKKISSRKYFFIDFSFFREFNIERKVTEET